MAVLAACGGSTAHGTQGDKTAFCEDNATISAATAHATSTSELATALKGVQSTVDDIVKHAPPEVKEDTQNLADATRKAISGDAKALTDPKLSSAAQRLDDFCGQSGSTPASQSTGSTSESSSSNDRPASVGADPCGLLATDDIQSVFGGTVTLDESGLSGSTQPPTLGSTCSWSVNTPTTRYGVSLNVRSHQSMHDFNDEQLLAPQGAQPQDVPGVGDAAFYASSDPNGSPFPVAMFTVLRGMTLIQITSSAPTTSQDQLTALARRVLAKL